MNIIPIPFNLTLFSNQSNDNSDALKVGDTAEILEIDENGKGVAENTVGQLAESLHGENLGSVNCDVSTDKGDTDVGNVDLKIRRAAHRSRKGYLIMGARYVENCIQSWTREEAALKEKYPDYSLEKAIKDPMFFKMLSLGISQEQAYRAIHFDSILNDEIGKSAGLYSDNLRSRGMRPCENGVLGSGAVAMKNGVSSLSRGQRANIAKRALNGEKISF